MYFISSNNHGVNNEWLTHRWNICNLTNLAFAQNVCEILTILSRQTNKEEEQEEMILSISWNSGIHGP